jgi:hypothetical protein
MLGHVDALWQPACLSRESRPGSEQLTLRSDIVANPAIINSAERCHSMAIGSSIQDVKDWNSARYDRIGDQRSMTAPGNCLGAHDGGRLEIGERQKVIERFLEFARLHVIGVRAEAGVSPQSVP